MKKRQRKKNDRKDIDRAWQAFISGHYSLHEMHKFELIYKVTWIRKYKPSSLYLMGL